MRNVFPCNHSVTVAMTGFKEEVVSLFNPTFEKAAGMEFLIAMSRMLSFKEAENIEIFNMTGTTLYKGQQVREVDLSLFNAGSHIVRKDKGAAFKLNLN